MGATGRRRVTGYPYALQLLAQGDPLVRRAGVVRVIDGDTFVGRITLWPDPLLEQTWSVRLLRINAPEAGEGGHAEATGELASILRMGSVTLQAVKLDKFAGRIDAVVIVQPDDPHLPPLLVADELVARGVAVRWDGRGKRPLVPWPPMVGPYAPGRVDEDAPGG